MKFHEIVNAHLEWRHDLVNEIKAGVTEKMISDTHKDDLCVIGHWLHGKGELLFSNLPEFVAAKKAHAEFHQAVALSLKNDGALNGEEECHLMLKSFLSLNDKVGHLD